MLYYLELVTFCTRAFFESLQQYAMTLGKGGKFRDGGWEGEGQHNHRSVSRRDFWILFRRGA